jgi:hypothetical protein
MSAAIHYFHYRNGTHPVSIAFSVDQTSGLVSWDASFCSKRDTFNKIKGRYIATARYLSNLEKDRVQTTSSDLNTDNLKTIRHKIVAQLESHPRCPQRFSAKLNQFSLE